MNSANQFLDDEPTNVQQIEQFVEENDDLPFGDELTCVANKQVITKQDRVDTQMKRTVMDEVMTQYFNCVDDLQSKKDRIEAQIKVSGESRKKDLRAQLRNLKLKLMMLNTSVGSGKSSLIEKTVKNCYDRQIKVGIVNHTHDRASKCADDVETSTGVKLVHVYGRAGKRDVASKPELASFLCHQKDEADRAARLNQLPAQSICRDCPHWYSHALKNVESHKTRLKAKEYFNKRKLDSSNFEPCQYLPNGIANSLASPAVIMVQQSFSEAFGDHEELDACGSVKKMQRLLIVDEKVPLAKEIEVNTVAVSFWKESLVRAVKGIKEKYPHSKMTELLIKSNYSSSSLDVWTCFTNMLNALNNGTTIDEAEIVQTYEMVKAANGFSSTNTAAWEKASFIDPSNNSSDKDFWIPLRALHNVANSIKHGTLRKTKTSIFAYEETPIIEWALTRGNTIFLDATASVGMKALIESVGGEIHEEHFKQNMIVTQHTGHLFARGNVRRQVYKNLAKKRMVELEAIAKSLLEIKGAVGQEAAIITHKAWLKYASEVELSDDAAHDMAEAFYTKTGVKLGWFGMHDRGHNDWKGHNIALVGTPLLSAENIASEYAKDRAALANHGIHWPEWDGVVPELSQEDWCDGKAPLPSQPNVKDWLLDLYSQGIAQGIGRARANDSERVIHVHLYGGLQTAEMEAALLKHGVRIDRKVEQTVHVTREIWAKRGSPDRAIRSAALLVNDLEGHASKRNVRAMLEFEGVQAAENSIIDMLRQLSSAGLIRQKSGGRDARKALEEDHPLNYF